MNKTGKAIPVNERLKRVAEYIDKANAMPEPSEARAHGDWIKKRRSCILHADKELRQARRMGADESEIKRLDTQVETIWNATKLRK
jgi:hypothetical protein